MGVLDIFEKLVSHPVLHTGAHIGYFSGLTTMLPLLGRWWDTSIKPWSLAPGSFYIALGLIALSIMLLSFAAGSIYKLLRSLGWLMILPGALAIAFSLFGEGMFWTALNSNIAGFAVVEPGVRWLVQHSVPNAAFIGAAYIFCGMLLIWAGRQVEHYSTYF